MLVSRPVPITRPRPRGRKRRIAAVTTLGLAGLLAGLLTGCGTGISPEMNTSSSANPHAAAGGNWKFSTAAGSSVGGFAGALTVTGDSVAGVLHPWAATCASGSQPFNVTGTINASGSFSITSTNFAGGRLAVSGILAEDQHSLVDPTITITGGACANSHARGSSPHIAGTASAQQYQPLTGNYNGTFTDSSGATLAVAASLSQPTTPDPNGVYHLTGFATFPNSACLSTPVVTDSVVTGDSIQATYSDSAHGSTVSGSGTFSPDAQTLTITSWILSGCGDDTGTGQLVRQAH